MLYMNVMTNHNDCPKQIPFAMLSERQAQYNHSQTLQKLNERGGMIPMEIVANIEHLSFPNLNLQHDISDEPYFITKLIKYFQLYKNGEF